MEADPLTGLTLFEEVSRVDSAAGWNLMLSAGAALFGQFFPHGLDDFYSSPNGILGGALNPPGKAIPVEGGYRVTGRSPFVSGCHSCEWLISPVEIVEGNDGDALENPTQHVVFYPQADAEIIDHWDTLGMRGTGSHDVAVNDIFVPEHRSGLLAPVTDLPDVLQRPLYRYSIWPAVASLATVAFGIARAAILMSSLVSRKRHRPTRRRPSASVPWRRSKSPKPRQS